MFDFNDLYYFYLTAENKGFTAAARSSGITKSLLSRRIAKLEEQLNVRLIQRNSRQFALTGAGQILLQHATEIVREGHIAWESLSQHVSEPSGMLRVSCPTVLAQYHLAPLLPLFMSRYPGVTIYLDATDRQVQIIEEGIDVALRVHRDADDNPHLIARKLAENSMVLVASPGLLSSVDDISVPAQLAGFPTVSYVSDHYEREAKWALICNDGRREVVRHKPSLLCMNPGVQLEAAISGIGIALLPQIVVAEALSEGQLLRILPEWTTDTHAIAAVFPTRKHLNPAVSVFIDFLAHHFREIFN